MTKGNDAIKIYLVGGAVRDELLGIKSKDNDYSVEAPSYQAMVDYIASIGKIYIEKPEHLTVRARVNGEDSDYVLCRKEGSYRDGRRPDRVEPGTLMDDLARRDFTVNAICKMPDGTYFDPFGGIRDLQKRILKPVGSVDRLREDSLRIVRAVRFKIQKGLFYNEELGDFLQNTENYKLMLNLPTARIMEEFKKLTSLQVIVLFKTHLPLMDFVFSNFPDLKLKFFVQEEK